MADERYGFIAETIASICEIKDKKEIISQIGTAKEVAFFLDDPR